MSNGTAFILIAPVLLAGFLVGWAVGAGVVSGWGTVGGLVLASMVGAVSMTWLESRANHTEAER